MKTRFLCVVAAAVGLLAGGCGDSDDVASGTIEIVGVDYAYEGLPDRIKAGSSLSFRNDSAIELHEVVAIRLPDGEERSVEDLLQLPPEEIEAVLSAGPPNAVIIAPPNEAGFVVEGAAVLDQPGRYAIICFIPTGADPGEYLAAAAESEGGPPDVPGGPPHFVEGMWAELTVE